MNNPHLNPPRDVAYFVFNDGAVLATGPWPHDDPRQNKFDDHGRWIGRDLSPGENPCRVITNTTESQLTGRQIVGLFDRYNNRDYGSGEPGFAVYSVDDNEYWLIDDAVRTPQGEPPARDPHSSPGPQTLLTPNDY